MKGQFILVGSVAMLSLLAPAHAASREQPPLQVAQQNQRQDAQERQRRRQEQERQKQPQRPAVQQQRPAAQPQPPAVQPSRPAAQPQRPVPPRPAAQDQRQDRREDVRERRQDKRQDSREDARERRQDQRQDRREDVRERRQDKRQDNREDVRERRQDQRQDSREDARERRQDQRQERREDVRERRQDQRQDNREDRREDAKDRREDRREDAQRARRLDDLRERRRETREGNRTVIREQDRTIIRDGNRTIIRHDEVGRFRRFGGRNVRVERRGRDTVTIIDRRGYRIVSIVGPNGRLLRRIRRYPNGREVVIIDNRPRAGVGFFLNLAPPVIRIPRERYIVELESAPPALIYDTLTAPPVEPIDRAYALDEIRYNANLRDRMPRIDIDTVTFDFGSWEVTPEQAARLEPIARAIIRAVEENPNEVYLIEGHTDAVGDETDNLSLSDRRAEEVAIVLTEQYQVPPENLTTQGYGEQYLKVPTEAAERRNRRVTVRRITPLLAGGEGQADAPRGGESEPPPPRRGG